MEVLEVLEAMEVLGDLYGDCHSEYTMHHLWIFGLHFDHRLWTHAPKNRRDR
jgi:hypothetical protein